jgi:endoglucanase
MNRMKTDKRLLTALCVLILFGTSLFGQAPVVNQTIVGKYGHLSVKGNYIIGQYGDTVQLRGMSMFWSQWQGQFYNAAALKWLRDDWKCTVVRAAMGVEHGGYIDNPSDQKDKVNRLVKAAIDLGIYVIIDYHSHLANEDPVSAKRFFTEMSKKWGKYPNVIYEIFNEPLQISWAEELKPYELQVIKAIRQNDPDNMIICGTRQWSQMVNEAAMDPIKDTNVAYTLHFYAGTHGESLRENAIRAMENGACIFVTEYGTCDASGNGNYSPEKTRLWFDFMDKYKISSCNWALSDKDETASALIFGASWTGGWKEKRLTESGKFIREELIKKNTPIFDSLTK